VCVYVCDLILSLPSVVLCLGSLPPVTNDGIALGRVHSNIRMSEQEVVSVKSRSTACKGQNDDNGVGTFLRRPSLGAEILERTVSWHRLLDNVGLAADGTVARGGGGQTCERSGVECFVDGMAFDSSSNVFSSSRGYCIIVLCVALLEY
jgi:hypothetical protein